MRYIVDGYNFLFRLQTDVFPLEETRNSFIQHLTEVLSQIDMRATLVFDSGQETILDIASSTHIHNTTIVFTPRGVSADDYIVELVEIEKHPATRTVISSDKGVIIRVSSLGAKTMSIEHFVQFVQRKLAKTKKRKEKLETDSDMHVRRLEEIFTRRLEDSSDEDLLP